MTKQKIRESLNKFDREALDNNTEYYDFVNMYEALNPQITNDDQKELEKCIREKDFKKLNTYLAGIESRDNKSSNHSISASVSESEEIEDNLEELNEIFDDDLDEGRNNLVPRKCSAIKSHKTYWSPFDTKEQEFAQYGTRFRYETKDACLDAIADHENDLGYDRKDKQKAEKAEESLNEAAFSPCAGGPFIVGTYDDHKAGKIRVLGDDGVNGLHNVAFSNRYRTAADEFFKVRAMSWNGKNYKVADYDIIGKINGKANIGPVQATAQQPAAQQTNNTVQNKSDNKPTQVANQSTTVDNSKLKRAAIPEAFDENGEEITGTITLGNVKVSLDSIGSEELDFIQAPIDSKGKVKAETLGILALYNHIYNLGETSVPRSQILKEAGVAKYNRQGEHSVWFTAWAALGLASLDNNGNVFPGSNLKGWVEGTIQPTGIIHHRGNPFSKDPKKYPTEPWDEQIGPGNPDGIDLRKYIPNSQVSTRPDQGLQPDRSHGKGDTTVDNSNKIKPNNVAPTVNTVSTTVDNSKLKKVAIPEDFSEEENKGNLGSSINSKEKLINKRRDTIRSAWKKYQGLDEDAEIDYKKAYNDDIFKHFCAMNGYSYAKDKDLFLGD